MLKLNKDDELLVFRSAGIGDFLVVLPFINYLVNIIGIPKEKIHFVVINNQNQNPFELIFDENDPLVKNSSTLSPQMPYKELIRIKSHYAKKEFTKIIYLPFINEPLKSKIKKYMSIRFIAGTTARIYGFTFKSKLGNIGTQYLTYFEQLGLKEFNKYLNFSISSITKFSKLEKIKSNSIKEDKKNIALYINSKLEMKIWNDLNFFKVVEYINNKYDANIYLIGGAGDIKFNDKFNDKYKLNYVENIAGKFSIRETILLLNKFDLLISNDGSPIHMAAYSDCAILGIYTYKEEISSWEPYKSSRFIAYRKNVSCKHCYLEFCSNTICLTGLKFEDVFSSIDTLLEAKQIKQSIVIY